MNTSSSSLSDNIIPVSNDEEKSCLESDSEDCDTSNIIEKVIDKNSLPSYNVPEKIIIVIDRAYDENCTYFEVASGKKWPPLFMLQHALKIFLHNKSQINPEHEYAIIQLNEYTATWVHDFTSSIQDILASVRSLTELPCEPEDIFDLNKVFDIINEKLDYVDLSYCTTTPPSYVVRTILFYGRSYSLPKLTQTHELERLLNSPYFTVDIVMTHEPPDSGNNCEQIFKSLQKIDMKGSSYTFSVSRNASNLHCAMAKILSHPLQRPHQVDANYNLKFLNTK
ncbi:hypothetical protein RN001_005319 [Aquatica leii]|uniref:BRISC and BRCA1-A complex member 1 n=1 Tax=Aquatica leii TaxID=1421715 RepID=A0AAN7SS16_9COLE|nr:hypothetical protein RN001_005319 [Aquatica leii]